MMVEALNTSIALSAMFGSLLDVSTADRAEELQVCSEGFPALHT
jgi:hypothetical protein